MALFSDLRKAARDEVTRALRDELGDDALLSERAENLVAIAIEEKVTVDDLLQWIGYRTPEKEWASAEFRGWGKKLYDLRAAVAAQPAACDSTEVCPNCFVAIAQRTQEGRWWCAYCGEIQ